MIWLHLTIVQSILSTPPHLKAKRRNRFLRTAEPIQKTGDKAYFQYWKRNLYEGLKLGTVFFAPGMHLAKWLLNDTIHFFFFLLNFYILHSSPHSQIIDYQAMYAKNKESCKITIFWLLQQREGKGEVIQNQRLSEALVIP